MRPTRLRTGDGPATTLTRLASRGGAAGTFAWLLCLVLLALVVGARSTLAQDLPELTQPVNDFATVIDAANATEMDRAIRALQQATGDVVVVATVRTYQPAYGDVREYAVKLFENHGKGIGEKDKHNGLLVLVAVQDRKAWIEVGYGLEEYITDGFAGETTREYMIPAFRQGDFGGGLRAGVMRIIGRIADARGVKLDGVQPVTRAAPAARRGLSPGIVIILIIAVIVLSRLLGGGGGSGGFGPGRRSWGGGGWSGWSSGIGSFGGGGGGGFGGGFGGFGGGGSGGGGGGGSW